MKRIDNEFFGASKADRSFNLQAATDAYYRVLNMGDEAEFVVRSVMFDQMDADFTAVRKGAQGLIDAHVQQTIAKAQRALALRISKGVDPGAYGAAEVLSEISKAYQGDQFNRDVRGRFAHVEQRKFNYEGGKKVRDNVVNRMTPGSKDIDTSHLDKETAAKMQQAYLGLHQMLQRARQYGVPNSDVMVDLTHENGDVTTHYGADAGKALGYAIKSGNPVVQADLHIDKGLSVGGAAFDVMSPLGNAGGMGAQAFRTATDKDNPNNFAQFERSWNSTASNPREPNANAYKRISTVAGFAESMLPEGTPGKVRLAVAAGKWVGDHGPEAEKVMGPGARKASYRYRGIERRPDAELLRSASAALTGVDNPNDRRKILIYGDRNAIIGYGPKRAGAAQGTPIIGDVESPVVSYLSGRLPDPALLKLQTESGHVPPSEGVIIDRNGKIVTQAVGYGDDHYLPFNLKNMSKLQGGEYVRTRAVGGLTTEDIYAGLVSGARAVTVVSNSGVYTMEFDPTFRGGRRFNDKAARMVNRYGMLLDSVKSETITLQNIPPDRYAELRQQAIDRYPDESEEGERTGYLRMLTEREKRDPQMSKLGKDAVAEQVLDDYAAAHRTADGGTRTWDDLKGEKIRQAQIAAANESMDTRPEAKLARAESARDMATALYDNPQTAITHLGLEERYTKSLARAEHEYRATQKPLKLNSDGYHAAQRALKEQFPYYISHQDMRPKTLGLDDASVGYVNPRYNRPAAARVGYFDPNIDGPGSQGAQGSKVSAQYTNYQNQRNSPTPGRSPAAAPAREEATQEAPSAPLPVNSAVLKDKALIDLLAHINAQTQISPNAEFEGVRGLSVHDSNVKASLRNSYGNVWGATSVPSDPTARAKMDAEIQAMIRNKLFDLDPAKVEALKGGRVAAEPAINGDGKEFVEQYLYGGKSNVRFGDAKAYTGGLTDPGSYAAHYRALVAGDHYVAKLGLGETLDAVTDEKIAKLKAELKQRYIDHEMDKFNVNSSTAMPRPRLKMTPEVAKQQIDQPAKALAKVEMLRKHYVAGMDSARKAQEAAPNVQINFHGPDSPISQVFAQAQDNHSPGNAAKVVQGEIEQGHKIEDIIPGWKWDEKNERTH